jgi:uncharacterized caspase-like protein
MKYALIIGNNKYDDPKLAQLKTPAADSQALAKVLDDKTIGSFDEVTPVINQTETMVRRIIGAFLTNKRPDDLVLLYFSGHGILDDRGRLYLALRDTQVNLLKATSIPSSFIADEMDSCRSKRQILVLDCCHSGAFGRGTKGEQKAVTETTFEGSGFGRVVLTASDSTQYAFEGDQVIKQTELSLFTHFLLEGLKTGEADINNDGHISLDEWYDYTYTKVISETPRQVPHKWSYNQQGDLIIAKNPYVKKRVVELPSELLQALESSFFGIRESAVTELGKYLRSRDTEMVELALASLEKMKADDSRRISSLAERLLAEFEKARVPAIKVTPPKPAAEVATETDSLTGVSSMPPPITTSEIKPVAERLISRPEVEKAHKPVDQPLVSQKPVFTPLFWLKWVGATVLVAAILNMSGNYLYNNEIFKSVPILFGVSAGFVSLAQWFLFPNELGRWWIAANTAAGIFMGLLFNFLAANYDWWDKKDTLFTVWVIGNFALGTILMWNAQEKAGPVAGTRTSQRELENLDRPVGRTSTAQGADFDRAFWVKWLGATIFATAILNMVGNALYENEIFKSLPVLIGTFVGLVSFVQRSMSQDRLGSWWIAANTATGLTLGVLNDLINNYSGWWGKDYFLVLWVIGNLILGSILIRKARGPVSLPSTIETLQRGARQPGLLMLISIYLGLGGLVIFTYFSYQTGFLSISDSLLKGPLLLYAIAGVAVSVTFVRSRDMRRNFGFITFAVFALLQAINAGLYFFFGDYPFNIFDALIGILALTSGVFFISQKDIWANKHAGLITMAVHLIAFGFAIFELQDPPVAFAILSILFALASAIFFLQLASRR